MAISREQVMAFVEAALLSPKVKVHLEAMLGFRQSPEMVDFASREEGAIKRCEEMISYLEETTGILRVLQETRERQAEIDFSKERNGKFCLSQDAREWNAGPYKNADEAAASARYALGIAPGARFFVGKAAVVPFPADLIDLPPVFDRLRAYADDAAIGDEWPKLTLPCVNALNMTLGETLKRFLSKSGQWPIVRYEVVKEGTVPVEVELGPGEFKCVTCSQVASRADGSHDTKAGPECIPCYRKANAPPDPEEPHSEDQEPAFGEGIKEEAPPAPTPTKRRRRGTSRVAFGG
jgi:hypothetical protein